MVKVFFLLVHIHKKLLHCFLHFLLDALPELFLGPSGRRRCRTAFVDLLMAHYMRLLRETAANAHSAASLSQKGEVNAVRIEAVSGNMSVSFPAGALRLARALRFDRLQRAL